MKIPKLFVLSLLIFTYFSSYGQKDDEKFYYKDTTFEFVGFKVTVCRAVATVKSFRASVMVSNTSDQFLIFNPEEIFAAKAGTNQIRSMDGNKEMVIAPKYNGRITVKFAADDYRHSAIEINIKSIKMTDKVEAIYELGTLDVFKEDARQTGPVKWKTTKRLIDDDKDKQSKPFQMDGTLEYTGDKFLGIFYNNIILTASDGKTYVNSGKTTNIFYSQAAKFYYDRSKPFEKMKFSFEAPISVVNPKTTNTISFSNVFKEYSLVKIEGFKVTLQQGTLADYKGTQELNSKGEKDIEEID